MFKAVVTPVDFVKQEHEVLDFWKTNEIFQKLRRLRAGSPHWSFIDGPITANNPMGAHHAWGRSYKDLWQRFWAMRGHELRYQNGFDCQGLWVEVEVEKSKGFKSKRDIESYGLDRFVLDCKARVLTYAARQTEQSIRLGYWMDWNSPEMLRELAELLLKDAQQEVTVEGPHGPVSGPVEQVVGRLGRPELGGSYFTFSTENNYTIWSFLKKVWEKGWLYHGEDVMPWCSRCATGLSQHEIVTEGYQELTHDSVVVRFPLRERDHEALLVWTTTPWTLSSNVGAAVGPELTYLKVRGADGWVYYLSEGTAGRVLKGKYEVLGRLKGAEMVGWTYAGPFDDLPAVREAGVPDQHRVIPWTAVGEEEGTGIVHIAPGCGAEDFQLGREFGLTALAPLTEEGAFLPSFGWLAGRDVHSVAPDIFKALETKERLYRVDPYAHRYPICWRCATPLVFRLVDEWYISMGKLYDKPREEVTFEEKEGSLRYQIMDVVDQIKWIPDFGYEREMDWLRNMSDWMISKKRYWGLALPIWVCPDCRHYEVLGDEEELKERAVAGWEVFEGHTPHRPYVDAIKLECPKCGGTMSRIPDVGNPWLDAGSVAYSTLGYRTNRNFWEEWFPAEWISESFPGQFRNWFYSLITMSTVFERRAPTKIVHGYATLLAEDGRAMHKSWGNAIWFDDAAEKMGVDTMRWLYLNQRLDQNMLFGYSKADETRRRFIIPLWNVYAFFINYARIDGWEPPAALLRHASRKDEGLFPVDAPWTEAAAPTEIDRWIVARLKETVAALTRGLESYYPLEISTPAEAFLDDLSNWYVRRNRRRFWGRRGASAAADADKEAAYQTLYTVLVTFAKLLAPLTPFLAETLYQNLVRSAAPEAPESVHHCLWPEAAALTEDEAQLVETMAAVRQAATLGHSVRATGNLKVRQPLGRALIAAEARRREALGRLLELLADELNVKEVGFVERESDLVTYKLLPLNKTLGPRFGARFPLVRKALAEVDASAAAARLHAGETLSVTLEDGTVAELAPEDVLIQSQAREGYGVAGEGGLVVALDTAMTPELIAEGLAREVIRRVQDLRKEAGYELTDRVVVQAKADGALAEALQSFRDLISGEVLADVVELVEAPEGDQKLEDKVEGQVLVLAVRKA